MRSRETDAEGGHRFVAKAAHELLNPIAAIIGFADTLLDRWDVLDDDAKLSALRTIRRQSEHLKLVAEDLGTRAEP